MPKDDISIDNEYRWLYLSTEKKILSVKDHADKNSIVLKGDLPETNRGLLEEIRDKLDLLNTRLSLIFGDSVLIEGKWIDLSGLKKE
jgi:hypothetical protein